jgi:hypothetical protein
MKLNELLLDFLQEEGYRPQVDPNDGEITFKSEGLTYSFFPDENDDQYFRLMLPAIYDVNEDNKYDVLEAIDKTNFDMKVIKLYIVHERSVWAAFEILADTTPEMKDIVPRAINMLRHGRAEFYQNLEN